MTIVLYDLVGVDDRRFSPNCWRTRMALAHKGLDCTARPTRFTEIPSIAVGPRRTLPTIDDGGTLVTDSWAIAEYLEDAYPDRPSLYDGAAGRGLSRFVMNWVATVLHRNIGGMVMADIHAHLAPDDQAHFRASREKMFGRTLEQIQGGRDGRLDGFRAALTPLRQTVEDAHFLGGAGPTYADYVAFAPFQWARSISAFKLLEDDDPVAAWVGRCLDLYDGLGRSAPAYY